MNGKWRTWTVGFEGRVKIEGHAPARIMLPESVTVLARDRVEAQQLAFRRASSTTLRPSDGNSGALWSYARPVGAHVIASDLDAALAGKPDEVAADLECEEG